MITEFRVACSRTLNLGNFQSAKIEASVTVALGDDDDFPQQKLAAQKELRRLLEETYQAQLKKPQPNGTMKETTV